MIITSSSNLQECLKDHNKNIHRDKVLTYWGTVYACARKNRHGPSANTYIIAQV